MQILLVSATELEMNVIKEVREEGVTYLITGVGTPLTLTLLLDFLHFHPIDLAIQVGLAGSFRKRLPVGSVGLVEMDAFADVAWHHGDELVPVYSSLQTTLFEPDGFVLSTLYPFQQKGWAAVTVNSPTLDNSRKAWLERHWNPDIETMEGAAFYFACQLRKIPAIQIRSISNYVGEPRSSWQIHKALRSLKEFVQEYLQKIKS